MQKIARRFTCVLLVCCMILTSFAFQLTSVAHGATFEARTTKPDFYSWPYSNAAGNPFSLNPATGGNCTYYAWGRAYEITGEPLPAVATSGNPNGFLSFHSNAMYFWYDNLDLASRGLGYAYGSTPKLGAIAVWDGAAWNGYCGHVAVVEEILDGTTFRTSNSSWSYTDFYMSIDSINESDLLGFIYLIDDTTNDTPDDTPVDDSTTTPEEPVETPDTTTPEEPTPAPDDTTDTTTPDAPDTDTPAEEEPTDDAVDTPPADNSAAEDPETPDTTPDVDPDNSETAPEITPDDDTATPVTGVTPEGTNTHISVDSLPDGASLSAQIVDNGVTAKISALAQETYGADTEVLEAVDISFYAEPGTQAASQADNTMTMTFALGDRFTNNGTLQVVQFNEDSLTPLDTTVNTTDQSVSFSVADSSTTYAVLFIPDQEEETTPSNPTQPTEAVEPTSITLNKTDITLFTGVTAQLTATVQANGTPVDASIAWSSSNPDVVSVDEQGNITGNAVGESTITARTDNGITATCKVTVQEKVMSGAQSTPTDTNTDTTANTTVRANTNDNPNTGISQEALMTGEVPAWMIPAIIAMLGAGLAIIGTYGYIHHKRNKRRI